MTDKITTDDILAALVKPLAECPECRCKTFATIQEFGGDEHRQGSRRRCVHCKLVIDDDADRARIAAALNLDLIRRVVAALKEACDHYEYVHNEPAPWRIIATTFQAITEKVDGISCLLAEAKARVDAMSPEERAAMLARQRESFVRAEIGFGSDADEAEYRAALESGDPAEIDRVKRKEEARLEAYDKIKEGGK